MKTNAKNKYNSGASDALREVLKDIGYDSGQDAKQRYHDIRAPEIRQLIESGADPKQDSGLHRFGSPSDVSTYVDVLSCVAAYGDLETLDLMIESVGSAEVADYFAGKIEKSRPTDFAVKALKNILDVNVPFPDEALNQGVIFHILRADLKPEQRNELLLPFLPTYRGHQVVLARSNGEVEGEHRVISLQQLVAEAKQAGPIGIRFDHRKLYPPTPLVQSINIRGIGNLPNRLSYAA